MWSLSHLVDRKPNLTNQLLPIVEDSQDSNSVMLISLYHIATM